MGTQPRFAYPLDLSPALHTLPPKLNSMKTFFLWSGVFVIALAARALAAEETPAKPAAPAAAATPATEEMIRARLIEHTKLKANPKSAAPATSASAAAEGPIATATPAAAEPTATAPGNKADAAAAAAQAKTEPAGVLPKVEVNRPRITVLDHELALQEKEIAHEKKLTKSSELDRALNNPKVSVSILGGESTKYRTNMASERVSLMESEKDIIEAIAHAKTKEEKAELQKELNEIKALRRDLEKSVR